MSASGKARVTSPAPQHRLRSSERHRRGETDRVDCVRIVLALRNGMTVSKDMFMSHLYGGRDEPELKIIDVFMCKLRKKLAAASGGADYVETMSGRGYMLREPHSLSLREAG